MPQHFVARQFRHFGLVSGTQGIGTLILQNEPNLRQDKSQLSAVFNQV